VDQLIKKTQGLDTTEIYKQDRQTYFSWHNLSDYIIQFDYPFLMYDTFLWDFGAYNVQELLFLKSWVLRGVNIFNGMLSDIQYLLCNDQITKIPVPRLMLYTQSYMPRIKVQIIKTIHQNIHLARIPNTQTEPDANIQVSIFVPNIILPKYQVVLIGTLRENQLVYDQQN
jgi:hypothetical protein